MLAAADLRRAVLARQLLTGRADLDLASAVSRVASLQAQYAPTMYVGLWSRLAGFRRDDLTAALTERLVVQGTMMRSTIHLTAADDYWPLNLAVRDARRAWFRRTRGAEQAAAAAAAADRVRAALTADDHVPRRRLDELAGPAGAAIGLFVDLVRVPPSGTWERRRADLFALAERWVGPEPTLPEGVALAHLVGHYLGGFGPASVHEIANWAGLAVGTVRTAVAAMALTEHRAEDGTVLVDRPDQEIPPASTPLPVRFLGTWEALLLTHARRAGILAEEDRSRIFGTRTPQSSNSFLVDGRVAGTWRLEGAHVQVTPWRTLEPAAALAVAEEAARLEAFHA